MTRQAIAIDWSRSQVKFELSPILKRFERYLRDRGYRESSITGYINSIKIYLNRVGNIYPTSQDATQFRESLIESNRSRSTVNNYSAAIMQFHRMQGQEICLPMLPVNNKIPYYFVEQDILSIFNICNNLKHYAMLSIAFFSLLRATELCNLDDSDVDLKSLDLRIRDGKCGKSAIVPISAECAEILREYLEIRPEVVLEDGSIPLFPTDYFHRWKRRDVYRMFIGYKTKAGISKPGGFHVFARHSPASILVKNGCDLLTIKELLRHNKLMTTARYMHLSDQVKRAKYEKFLVL
jgi:integrase/recombinase XerD